MEVETTKMSSKGQVVIPQGIREEVRATEGTVFAVMANGDMIVLKRIEKPSKEKLIRELEVVAKQGRARLEKRGLKESDIHG